jgi:hypothetical protein
MADPPASWTGGFLNVHKFDLEIIRSVASGPDLEKLDRRVAAAQLLLEWIAPALARSSSFPSSSNAAAIKLEPMVTITITADAFAAIAGTLVEGSKARRTHRRQGRLFDRVTTRDP